MGANVKKDTCKECTVGGERKRYLTIQNYWILSQERSQIPSPSFAKKTTDLLIDFHWEDYRFIRRLSFKKLQIPSSTLTTKTTDSFIDLDYKDHRFLHQLWLQRPQIHSSPFITGLQILSLQRLRILSLEGSQTFQLDRLQILSSSYTRKTANSSIIFH